MLSTTHAATGALIGAACRTTPGALLVGWCSHFVLDALPHWGSPRRDRFLRVARVDGIVMLVATAALMSASSPERRSRVAAGVFGAVAPDLDKPVRHFFAAEIYPAALRRFHARVQRGRESDERLLSEGVRAAALLALAGTVLRRAR